VLQCVAVCCSVLQCVAVCCSVLQCVAVCCSVCEKSLATRRIPEHTATHCNKLQHTHHHFTATHCNTYTTISLTAGRKPLPENRRRIITNSCEIACQKFSKVSSILIFTQLPHNVFDWKWVLYWIDERKVSVELTLQNFHAISWRAGNFSKGSSTLVFISKLSIELPFQNFHAISWQAVLVKLLKRQLYTHFPQSIEYKADFCEFSRDLMTSW